QHSTGAARAELVPVCEHRLQMLTVPVGGAHIFNDVVHRDDRMHIDTEFAFDLVDSRNLALSAFLPVDADQHTTDPGTGVGNGIHDLTDGCAGGNDIVNH